MEFSSLPEFDKQLKTLLRKYRTLEKDLDLLKTVLEKHPRGYPPGIVRVSRLGINTEIYKVKHFRCKFLKHRGSRSGIRIIYAFLAEEEKIEFVEIYYKEKDNIECDKNRILRYYS
jgi:mRNA-degrading endonuclease RelE of RelBE toxin-antitoxin system